MVVYYYYQVLYTVPNYIAILLCHWQGNGLFTPAQPQAHK
jgi:hypothetical protein